MHGCGVDSEGRWRCMAVDLDGIDSCFRLLRNRYGTTRRSDCLEIHGTPIPFQLEPDTAPDHLGPISRDIEQH